MVGFDKLVAASLETIIIENLGQTTMLKIKSRLETKYGITLTESIEQFQKFDTILREIFGAGADGLEKKFLKSICKIKKSESKDEWYSIEDELIKKVILEAYGDEGNVKILDFLNQESKTVAEILEKYNFPQTSGYRKINNLIDSGLLIENGVIISSDKKRISKYKAIFKSVRINIVKNKLNIDIQFDKNSQQQSAIMQIVYNL